MNSHHSACDSVDLYSARMDRRASKIMCLEITLNEAGLQRFVQIKHSRDGSDAK